MRPLALTSAAILAGLVALLHPRRAEAGCGFYAPPAETSSGAALVNDADQVVMMREGTRLALTMSTNYIGPTEDFAMIVPVPVVLKQESVKTLSPAIFSHLEKLTAPRIVEYQETDPCAKSADGIASATGVKPPGAAAGEGAKGGGGGGVKVEAEFVSGEYDIVVLSATESDGLEKWLVDHKYKIPKGAAAALAPYVTAGQKFVVAKVDSKRVIKDTAGAVVLSPLRFVYETNDFRLPVRLGLLNAPPGGKQDVIVYVLTRGRRVESANYPNVFSPTNVDVDASVVGTLGSFYAALFDATVKKTGGKGVVTEYAWSALGCGSPCTSAPLAIEELDKLGGDDLLGAYSPGDLALTRLHARYDESTLSEDIVFRTADPVAGGKEHDPGAEQSDNVAPGPLGFQTKFAVRHPWPGALDCPEPQRGNWVPTGAGEKPAALGLASVPRDGAFSLMVMSPIAALGIAPQRPGYGVIGDGAPKPTSKVKTARDTAPASDPSTPWTWLAVGVLAVLAAFGGAIIMRRSSKTS